MKNFTDTALHVYFAGTLRICGCDSCRSLWYFTFNGAECSSPGPLKVRSTCKPAGTTIFFVTAILKVTVIISTRERCEWDSGLKVATLAITVPTQAQAGGRCPGSSLKKLLKRDD